MVSTGSLLRARAVSATERCAPCTLSITKIRSNGVGLASVPRAWPSYLAAAAATSVGHGKDNPNAVFANGPLWGAPPISGQGQDPTYPDVKGIGVQNTLGTGYGSAVKIVA